MDPPVRGTEEQPDGSGRFDTTASPVCRKTAPPVVRIAAAAELGPGVSTDRSRQDSNGLLPTCMHSSTLLSTPFLGRWQFTHRDGHERRVERNLSWLLMVIRRPELG